MFYIAPPPPTDITTMAERNFWFGGISVLAFGEEEIDEVLVVVDLWPH